ncbi:MAG: histidine phosphatase family protein [Kiritimatiellia bacterium]|jgi:broad specificity phosphatase PhoE
MKLLFIRHADPDYAIDSLTPKGWREAEMLAGFLSEIDVLAYYVSPLGRAKDTASLTLARTGRTATECPWLREFTPAIRRPGSPGIAPVPWDWLPQDWTADERFYRRDLWAEPERMREGGVREAADEVAREFDALLETHGYRRDGNLYRALAPSNATLVFFCHFGVECLLLGHLLGLSPMVLWHATCAAPSSITTVATEERREGIACFRMLSFGATPHLAIHGEPPAFAARFRECHANDAERRD